MVKDEEGRISFGDGKEWARVVCDSWSPAGRRLISVEVSYWRAIHAELMTHRDRGRNAASSRAIPFYREKKCSLCGKDKCGCGNRVPIDNCMYAMIERKPFFPEFLGVEQKGMQSGGELVGDDRAKALKLIDDMRQFNMEKCLQLSELNLHKSIINRYLEPWMYITVLMTATEWNNFFRLRIHPKAEKHFNKMAKLVKEAINQSTPETVPYGSWHTPYIRPGEKQEIYDMVASKPTWLTDEDLEMNYNELAIKYTNMISAARSARLSYLTHEGVRSFDKDIQLFYTLISPEAEEDQDVIHASPLEHVARSSPNKDLRSGPLVGWHQLRKDFRLENVPG